MLWHSREMTICLFNRPLRLQTWTHFRIPVSCELYYISILNLLFFFISFISMYSANWKDLNGYLVFWIYPTECKANDKLWLLMYMHITFLIQINKILIHCKDHRNKLIHHCDFICIVWTVFFFHSVVLVFLFVQQKTKQHSFFLRTLLDVVIFTRKEKEIK